MSIPSHPYRPSSSISHAASGHPAPHLALRGFSDNPEQIATWRSRPPETLAAPATGGTGTGQLEPFSMPTGRFRGVHDHFEELAASIADGPMLRLGGRTLDRAEADRHANRLARYLRASGVDPRTTVAICLENIDDRVWAMIAVLKAGATCILLDPADPPRPSATTLEENRASALLVRGPSRGCTADPVAHVIDLNAVDPELLSLSCEPLGIAVDPNCAMCIVRAPGAGIGSTVRVDTHAAMIDRVMQRCLAPRAAAPTTGYPQGDRITEASLTRLLDLLTPGLPAAAGGSFDPLRPAARPDHPADDPSRR